MRKVDWLFWQIKETLSSFKFCLQLDSSWKLLGMTSLVMLTEAEFFWHWNNQLSAFSAVYRNCKYLVFWYVCSLNDVPTAAAVTSHFMSLYHTKIVVSHVTLNQWEIRWWCRLRLTHDKVSQGHGWWSCWVTWWQTWSVVKKNPRFSLGFSATFQKQRASPQKRDFQGLEVLEEDMLFAEGINQSKR